MKPSNVNVKPQREEAAVTVGRHEPRNDDYAGVIPVATAWLVFYGLAFGVLAFNRGGEVLAYLY